MNHCVARFTRNLRYRAAAVWRILCSEKFIVVDLDKNPHSHGFFNVPTHEMEIWEEVITSQVFKFRGKNELGKTRALSILNDGKKKPFKLQISQLRKQ